MRAFAAVLASAGLAVSAALAAFAGDEWPTWSGDAGGLRYSPHAQIDKANVDRLEIAWVHHSGDVSDGKGAVRSASTYEATPILVDGTLYVCSPFNRVFALDPETGAERWVFDPKLDFEGRYGNDLVCRGVASWLDPERAEDVAGECRRRIFTATNDARLIALDAASGRPCSGFGRDGEVDLARGVGEVAWRGEYQVTSPPALIHDLVIIGSAVSDNQRTDAPAGVVRAYDVRSGALRWSFDPVPAAGRRAEGRADYRLGTPNVWAAISVDEGRDLVFLPTGNSSPDYYGGQRGDLDEYASSVVALRGRTGEVVWRFQTVHHDLWDYDLPAQPVLTTLKREGREIPVLIQTTKTGLVFVLDRETGEPVIPVEERPVPQAGVPGEKLARTQPFPVQPPPLVRHRIGPDDAWGLTPLDRGWCRRRIESLRAEGSFTPPSLQGTLMVPGNAGGSNWGGVAVDPLRGLVLVNTSDLPYAVSLFPAEQFAERKRAEPGTEISPQRGTPYGVRREALLSPLGLPCIKPPWGQLAAIDLASGEIRWQVRLGTTRDISPVPVAWRSGTPNLGGPLVTASGLVFIGAAMDDYLRAFDAETGRELWKGRLPAGGQASPMTYLADPHPGDGGRQFVVIAAGGHSRAGTRLGDALVAFTLAP